MSDCSAYTDNSVLLKPHKVDSGLPGIVLKAFTGNFSSFVIILLSDERR